MNANPKKGEVELKKSKAACLLLSIGNRIQHQ